MLKELFNKGYNYINDGIKNKKSSIEEYNNLINNSMPIDNLMEFKNYNEEPSKGREKVIMSRGITLNLKEADLVNRLIPLDETVILAETAKEEKTNIEFICVLTDKKVWLLNEKSYKHYSFSDILDTKLVDKSILSQGVRFDNRAFRFEGNEPEISKFIYLLNDEADRNIEIRRCTEYLKGVIPRKQFLNEFLSGMTFGDNGEAVLHDKMQVNTLIKLSEVESMQILMDNSVVYSRGRVPCTSQISAEKACREIKIKFTLASAVYTIDILPSNAFNSLVEREDTHFQESVEFSKNLISYVEGLSNRM